MTKAQDQLRVTLKKPITEDDDTYGPVLEGEYLTQGGMHFVMLKGKGGIHSKVVGPIDPANVVDIRITKTRDQTMNERFARSRGEPFDMKLERTRDGYETYLRALADAIAKQADPRRRDQLEMQFDDIASEVELAKKKRKWLLAEARYRNGGGTKDYPTRFDFTDSASDAVMKFQRPKPTDFEPDEKIRRAREAADTEETAPRHLINDLRRQGFGARFSTLQTGHGPGRSIPTSPMNRKQRTLASARRSRVTTTSAWSNSLPTRGPRSVRRLPWKLESKPSRTR
jgi:hypothetical protein